MEILPNCSTLPNLMRSTFLKMRDFGGGKAAKRRFRWKWVKWPKTSPFFYFCPVTRVGSHGHVTQMAEFAFIGMDILEKRPGSAAEERQEENSEDDSSKAYHLSKPQLSRRELIDWCYTKISLLSSWHVQFNQSCQSQAVHTAKEWYPFSTSELKFSKN